jgi:hypothetical protein
VLLSPREAFSHQLGISSFDRCGCGASVSRYGDSIE